MTGGFHPWSIFNEHRWSNLNARGQKNKQISEGAKSTHEFINST
jgi:hypothetical protein